MALSIEDRSLMKQKTAKPLMWVAMVSMIMLFAGLTSAYLVRHAEGNWLIFELPQWFLFSTAVIILSGLTMLWATQSARKNIQANIKMGVGLTLLLGLIFGFCQIQAYNELVAEGIFMAGSQANASGSFLYVISGVHLAHVAGGLLALLITFFQAQRGKYNSEKMLGLQLCAMYWHFLGLLWIYLFVFLYLIR